MKTFPVIETDRLILRRITPEDEADVFAIFSNPEVTRFYDLDTFTDRAQARELIERHRIQFEKDAGIRSGHHPERFTAADRHRRRWVAMVEFFGHSRI